MLTGALLQAGLSLLLQQEFPLLFAHQALGFIVPGLITYQLQRQPKTATVLSTGTVTFATWVIPATGLLLGALPTT